MQLFQDPRLHTVKVHVRVVLADEEYAGIGQPLRQFPRGQELAGACVGNTVQHHRNLPPLPLRIPISRSNTPEPAANAAAAGASTAASIANFRADLIIQ